MANETAYSYQAPDQLVYNLLTGGGSRLGLLPTVEDYYRSQLQQLGGADTSPFTYTGERIAEFSPREELAMQLADQGIGSFAPFLARSAGLTEESLATLAGGTSEAKAQLLRALQQGEDYTKLGIGQGSEFLGEGVDKASEAEQGLLNALAGVRGRGEAGYQSGLANILQGTQEARTGLDQASPFFTQARAEGLAGTTEALTGVRAGRESELSSAAQAEAAARRATNIQDPYLQEALGQVRSSTAGFDTADIDRFQNPFEEAVVQQTIKDLEKAAAQRDIASDAAEVTSGAFGGSRSRLGAQERQIAETRGLAEALAGIRGQGFTSARDAALGEFARQRGAEAGAGSQIAGLGAQAGSAQAGLAQTLAGLGAQRGAAQRGAASEIAGLGAQRSGFETGAGTALSNLAQQRFNIGTGAGSQQAGLAGQSAAQQLGAAQAGQAAKQATAATLGQAGQQIYGMGTGAGQQLFGMGTGAGQQLSGLAGQLAAGQQQGAQAMAQQAQLRPQLQAGDVGSLMQTGAMNRARNQAQMDLNYQNFVGQYNLPNQLLSGYANFLTGAGPLAGGTGYSGTSQQTPFQTGGAGSYTNYGPGYGGYKEGGQVEEEKQGPRGGINTPFQALEFFGVDQETIDELAATAGDMPKALVDAIISMGQKARDAGLMEEPRKKSEGGQPIPNKGLAALAKKAPEVVRRMGFNPAKKSMGGGLSSRFPRASRKLGA